MSTRRSGHGDACDVAAYVRGKGSQYAVTQCLDDLVACPSRAPSGGDQRVLAVTNGQIDPPATGGPHAESGYIRYPKLDLASIAEMRTAPGNRGL